MTTSPNPELSPREDLFSKYAALAARVQHLRAILQNEGPVSREDARLWSEDTKSVMADLMILSDLTAAYLRLNLSPLEVPK
jgi:hypothetical protein